MPPEPLALPPSLRHTYYAVRHGHSVPNADRIIVSTVSNGILPQYGLSDLGKQQSNQLAHDLCLRAPEIIQANELSKILFLVSPFSRAQDTANIVSSFIRTRMPHLPVEVRTIRALRERDFGTLELMPDSRYRDVWDEDANAVTASKYMVEHVVSVWNRVARVIASTEEGETTPCLVLLVSHGDTLQITEAGLRGLPLHMHRTIPHLEQAERRPLTKATRVPRPHL